MTSVVFVSSTLWGMSEKSMKRLAILTSFVFATLAPLAAPPSLLLPGQDNSRRLGIIGTRRRSDTAFTGTATADAARQAVENWLNSAAHS